jgi:hypothetical protein
VPEFSKVSEAIAYAERLLPGVPAPEGEHDERWQAIIEVGEFIMSDPDEVWEFTVKWGKAECEDVRTAVATCLLEHLIEHHFDRYFEAAHELAKQNESFRFTFSMCWALQPDHERAFEQARASLADLSD